MSFDLGVWFEPEPITDQQAMDKYQSLCDCVADTAVPTHPQVRPDMQRFPMGEPYP